MSTTIKSKKGKPITLLNPAEKAKKFVNEIRWGRKMTNNGEFKSDKKGQYVDLTKEQQAYRAGYLDSRKDNSKAYKSNRRKGR